MPGLGENFNLLTFIHSIHLICMWKVACMMNLVIYLTSLVTC
jgi:hypothetical protein